MQLMRDAVHGKLKSSVVCLLDKFANHSFHSTCRTESVSSEEEEDWPTSPIIPIFEQC